MYSDHLAVGLAGEHLVCADLLAQGHAPFRTEQGAAYDIAVDVDGRLLRIQVKACTEPRPFRQERQQHLTGYTWNTRHGKGANRGYREGSIDGFALVALDIRRVAYIPPGRQIFQLATSGSRAVRPRDFCDYPFSALFDA